MSERKMPILFKHKDECCGCSACITVCPVNAISMVEDNEGFFYPLIDSEKCICCNSCIKLCPEKNSFLA